MALAIKAENLSKAYQLGEIGTGTLSRDLERWFAKIRGKEDPFLQIGETNDRASKGTSGVVWSLKDINFDIKEGDAVGIIGRNGAGKSTLLKLLSRVTSPTTGSFKVKGRIASLLEVGTGFHPELTGRENIFLNGAILGMRKHEIRRKFDDIVAFSGVERYVDTPVKRYSSGMYVRLAFAVAAYLESEILIVDEVLAVGDAEFQRKCIGKMSDVSKGEGRTVLFVSHNMNSIASLCNKGILLDKGSVGFNGSVSDCISLYYHSNNTRRISTSWEATSNAFNDAAFSVEKVALVDETHQPIKNGVVETTDKLLLIIEGKVSTTNPALKIGYELLDENENILYTSLFTDTAPDAWPVITLGHNQLVTQIPTRFLYPKKYTVRLHISLHHQKWICNPKEGKITVDFEILKSDVITPYWEESGIINIEQPFTKLEPSYQR